MYKILLGVPSDGRLTEEAAKASWNSSLHHDVERRSSCNGSVANFNALWVQALQLATAGEIDFFAIQCGDIAIEETDPRTRYLDRMVEELIVKEVAFLSCPTSIKDRRKLTSSGIGNPDNPWQPWRRFSTMELDAMPVTFTAADIGYSSKYLLHNQHLCLWDMRDPRWLQTDAEGKSPFVFNFTEEIVLERQPWPLEGQQWVLRRVSEDWAFSRILWEQKVPTAITRRIRIDHPGVVSFKNYGSDGVFQTDENAFRWLGQADPSWLPQPCGDAI